MFLTTKTYPGGRYMTQVHFTQLYGLYPLFMRLHFRRNITPEIT